MAISACGSASLCAMLSRLSQLKCLPLRVPCLTCSLCLPSIGFFPSAGEVGTCSGSSKRSAAIVAEGMGNPNGKPFLVRPPLGPAALLGGRAPRFAGCSPPLVGALSIPAFSCMTLPRGTRRLPSPSARGGAGVRRRLEEVRGLWRCAGAVWPCLTLISCLI